MPGGNTSSSKQGYRMLKGGGQKAPDVRALSGGETFGDEMNMQLFDRGGQGEYKADTEYGLSNWSHDTPDGGGFGGNAQGYKTEKPGSQIKHPGEKIGSPAPSRLSKPTSGANPQPGGGWE